MLTPARAQVQPKDIDWPLKRDARWPNVGTSWPRDLSARLPGVVSLLPKFRNTSLSLTSLSWIKSFRRVLRETTRRRVFSRSHEKSCRRKPGTEGEVEKGLQSDHSSSSSSSSSAISRPWWPQRSCMRWELGEVQPRQRVSLWLAFGWSLHWGWSRAESWTASWMDGRRWLLLPVAGC